MVDAATNMIIDMRKSRGPAPCPESLLVFMVRNFTQVMGLRLGFLICASLRSGNSHPLP